MSKPIIKIVNAETGDELEREMNNVEFAQFKADLDAEIARQSEFQAKAAAKAALLERLGITEDEAKLLLS